MSHTPRPYQDRFCREIVRALWKNPIGVLPTGGGKSFCGSRIIHGLAGSALWVAHRRELIHQAADHLRRHNLDVGIIMAGSDAETYSPRLDEAPAEGPKCWVASIQTLARRNIPKGVQLIVVDEVHHARADSYRRLFSIPDARGVAIPVVGLTATPFRLDGRGLGELFQEIVVGAYPDELIRDGYLVAPVVYCGATPDLHNVRITAGDYNARDLDNAIERANLVGDIVATWHKHAGGAARPWRTVCYAASIEHSQRIVREFVAAGVQAEHLDGTTPKRDRDSMLARLQSGDTELVSNYGVLTEGYDLPALSCCILARPTASLNLHLQMVGRVLRPADGKAGAVVLDHAGNHHRHGAVTRRLEYTLEGTVRAAREQPPGALGMRHCRECLILVDVREPSCTACGASMERERAGIEVVNGELVEFDDTSHAHRKRVWAQIVEQADASGYSDGWCKYRFKERFGVWPVIADGELVDVAHATMDQKRAVYAELVELGRSKGWKDGAASHRYRDIFGVWPNGFVAEVRDSGLASLMRDRWELKHGVG